MISFFLLLFWLLVVFILKAADEADFKRKVKEFEEYYKKINERDEHYRQIHQELVQEIIEKNKKYEEETERHIRELEEQNADPKYIEKLKKEFEEWKNFGN